MPDEILATYGHAKDPRRRWLRHTYQEGPGLGTPFTDRGFDNVPALAHLAPWLDGLRKAA
ncbi:MAG TPA: hypothetical protein VMT85_22690 [Thermoanaerobaculia bacterium]|nr:hypothetical protein [Thermoanaerobaculia bacterium]